MNTYGEKGHVQQCWIKDCFKINLNEADIHDYIIQLNFQLVRTNDLQILKYNWQINFFCFVKEGILI